MKKFKFINLPKEEVLSEAELSFMQGASNCTNYYTCRGDKDSECGSYNSGPCTDCSPGLYCSNYTF